jgi:hypothetical protein
MRIEPEGSADSAVSIITQIAVQLGTDRVTFAADRPQVVWVDGAPAAISQTDPVIKLAGGTVTEVSYDDYIVALNTGEVVIVNPFGDGMGVSIALSPTDGPGSVQGFMGPDEGQSKDFQLPDGTVLQQPLTQQQFYQEFANAWRVSDSNSLLDYASGQTTATFTNTMYPREILTLADFPADLVSKAAALAAAAGITDPTLAADAEFDYITMGNASFFSQDATVAGLNPTTPTPAVVTQPVTPPPSIGILPAEPEVVESSGTTTPVTFIVNLTSAATTDTVVDYTAVSPTSTTSGKDFLTAADFGGTLPSGSVTITAGQTEADVTIDVQNSAIGSAANRWLMLSVTSPGGDLVYDPTGQVSIVNNAPVAGTPPGFAVELVSDPTLMPTVSGSSWMFDLGTVPQNSNTPPIELAVVNTAANGSDDLGGSIAASGDGSLATSSQPSFANVAPGGVLDVATLSVGQLNAGTGTETFTFAPVDTNDSGYSAILPTETVTVAETALCFLSGTMIATPSSEAPVERLAVGDMVCTLGGQKRPIAWIGTGRVLATRGRRNAATPIIVRKGALADNMPHRDLRVTKGHSLYLDGVLIPVEFLVNHRSILWDDRAQEVSIHHIELDTHDVLLANGAPAESYRDDGNRWLFQSANPGWTLAPQEPCAPILTGGSIVDDIWRRLLDRAGPRPGTPLTDEPDLHLLVDSKRIDPLERTAGRCAFRLPPRPHAVRVRSRSAVPQELGTARDDRCLGVSLRRIVLAQAKRQKSLGADAATLADGWHKYEAADALRWTDGDAALPASLFAGVTTASMLILHTGPTTQYIDDGSIASAA